MPINPKLKEQIEKTQMDDAYRATLLATLDNAPAEVQNLWMSQADYTRQTNAFKAEQTEWKAKADDFYTKSNASIAQWKSEVQKANDAVTAAQAKIAELEAGGGGAGSGTGGSPELTKEIQKLQGGITALQEKLSTAITPEVLDEKLGAAYSQAVGFIGEQTVKLRSIERMHEGVFGAGTFGEKETNELLQFANEQGKALGRRLTLDDAYAMKYGADLKTKEHEKVAADAIEKYKSTQGTPGSGGPSGGAPSGMEKGPLQIRMEQLAQIEQGKPGIAKSWQEAAAEAGQELVKEGKY